MNVRDAIFSARIALLINKPWWGELVMWMIPIASTDIPTAAVSKDGFLLYNEKWLSDLNKSQLQTVIAHETFHLMSKVFARQPIWCSHTIWNIANDIVGNMLLAENGFDFTGKLTNSPGIGKDYAKFRGMTTEEVAKILVKEQKEIENFCAGVLGNIGREKDDESEGDCEGIGKGKENKSGQNALGAGNAQSDEELELTWKQRVISATSNCRGSAPGVFQTWLNEILNPKIDWRSVIKRYVATAVRGKKTWMRPSKRSICQGIRLQGRDLKLPTVAITLDTSGSMGEEEMNIIFSETTAIIKLFNAKLRVLLHDVMVYYDAEVSINELHSVQVKKGGTSHRDVFTQLAKSPPALAICFTDMYSNFPDTIPTFPVLWGATNTTEHSVPFGVILDCSR